MKGKQSPNQAPWRNKYQDGRVVRRGSCRGCEIIQQATKCLPEGSGLLERMSHFGPFPVPAIFNKSSSNLSQLVAEGNSQDFLEELGKAARCGVPSGLFGIAWLCKDGVLWGNTHCKGGSPHESPPPSLSVPKTQTPWCPSEEQGDGCA